MRRRDFLIESGRAVLGFTILPLGACSSRNQPSAESAAGSPDAALIADLEAGIPRLLKDANVPGLSIALIKDAKLVWRRGFGVKDSASKQAVDNDTMFEAASMSKPVFAYAVMKLCERGVMNLDTPLTKYTSERIIEGDPRLDLITARHVLCHASGFQNWRSEDDSVFIVSVERKCGYVAMTNGDGADKVLESLISRPAMTRFMTS
jgi:CubicO group peptidase (beta-lactamase class C family)